MDGKLYISNACTIKPKTRDKLVMLQGEVVRFGQTKWKCTGSDERMQGAPHSVQQLRETTCTCHTSLPC